MALHDVHEPELTHTIPDAPDGTVSSNCVSFTTEYWQAMPPIVTVETFTNPLPFTVTRLPAAADEGENPATDKTATGTLMKEEQPLALLVACTV